MDPQIQKIWSKLLETEEGWDLLLQEDYNPELEAFAEAKLQEMEANLQLEELNHLEEGWEMLTDEDFKLQQEDEETLLESVDSEERFSTLTKTNPNSIYIKGNFYFKGYKKYSLDLYVDTGASMCTANKHVIPEEFWVNAKNPIKLQMKHSSYQPCTKQQQKETLPLVITSVVCMNHLFSTKI